MRGLTLKFLKNNAIPETGPETSDTVMNIKREVFFYRFRALICCFS